MGVRPVVVVDVDGTVADGSSAPRCLPRPGAHRLITALVEFGFEVVFWSAGGAEHAKSVASACGFPYVRQFFTKPDYPMDEDEALKVLGCRPALQVDDDVTERVADWPFLLVDGWYGEEAVADG